MALGIKLTVDSGDLRQQLDRFVTRVGGRAASAAMRDTYLAVGKRLLAFWRRRFYTPSLRSWPPLAESTKARKRAKGTLGKGILRDDDFLFNSLVPGRPGNILRVVADGVQAGSSDGKLKFHQRGTARMPRREVLVVPDGVTVQEINKVGRAGIARAAAETFRPGTFRKGGGRNV